MNYMRRIFLLSFFFVFYSSQFSILYAQTSTISVDPNNIVNQIGAQINCGKIGQACCNTLKIPRVRMSSPKITPVLDQVLDWIVGYINTVIEGGFSLVDWVAGHITEITGQIACSEKNSMASNKNDPTNCRCLPRATFNIAALCLNIADSGEKTKCIECAPKGVWTALGCVDFSLETFVKEKVFTFGIGLAGIVSLLCIIYAAFTFQTSQGNPEKIKKAQELLTSCIMGLMLIIFSIFILRLIGVNILKIPGLS